MRACLLAAAICAATSSSHAQEIVKPTWLKQPDAKDIMRYYPHAAAKAGVKGQAVIDCKVSALGSLYDCAMMSEAPSGYGFGGAAVAVSRTFRMTPMLVDGKATDGGQVTVPVIFNVPDSWLRKLAASLSK